MNEEKPWSFCETPEEKCTMNYCDENGCQNRQRNHVEANDLIADFISHQPTISALKPKQINIAKRISMVRQARGLTIEQVSKKTGKSTYDRVETGKIEPKFSELMKICEVLNVEIWELTARELIIKYCE